MTPFFFGPDERQLFGLYQPGQTASRAGVAALLCNPFGQETVRAHRMYRVLADRLSRAGVDVLRFDYFATGDSPGDDDEGEPAGWVDDLVVAHGELLRRSLATRVVWMGARLGATLAAMASTVAPRAPDRLVLWEPIVDGPAYLQELAERHVETLKASFNAPAPWWSSMFDRSSEEIDREGVGFELGASLRSQLAAMKQDVIPTPRAGRCDLIERGERPNMATLAMRWRGAGLQLTEITLKHDFDWLAAEALNTALVPTEAVQLLSQLMTDGK